MTYILFSTPNIMMAPKGKISKVAYRRGLPIVQKFNQSNFEGELIGCPIYIIVIGRYIL